MLGGKWPLAEAKVCVARTSWRRLLLQARRRAASRACWTAGSNNPSRTPIMAITTSSSISVKAARNEAILRYRLVLRSNRGWKGDGMVRVIPAGCLKATSLPVSVDRKVVHHIRTHGNRHLINFMVHGENMSGGLSSWLMWLLQN